MKKIIGGILGFSLFIICVNIVMAQSSRPFSADLIEGQSYTISQLSKNRETTERVFQTDGFVINKDSCSCPGAPAGSYTGCFTPSTINISESYGSGSNTLNTITLQAMPFGYTVGDMNALSQMSQDCQRYLQLNVGGHYRFTVKVKYDNSQHENVYALVSVKGLNGEEVTTPTPPIEVNQPVKESIFVRLLNWFLNLFR